MFTIVGLCGLGPDKSVSAMESALLVSVCAAGPGYLDLLIHFA